MDRIGRQLTELPISDIATEVRNGPQIAFICGAPGGARDPGSGGGPGDGVERGGETAVRYGSGIRVRLEADTGSTNSCMVHD